MIEDYEEIFPKSQESNDYYINDFIERAKVARDKVAISTGFERLDFFLDGGLHEDTLYFVGSICSLGKTSLVLQIANAVAKQGNIVLIFSLEMARRELIAKSASQISFAKSGWNDRISITTREMMQVNYKTFKSEGVLIELDEAEQNEKREIMNQSVNEYAKYADKIFVYEGAERTTIETINKEITALVNEGCKPVVFIDYMQLIAPSNARKSDKQTLDETVTLLKQIARDYKIPIIGISSFNRDSYTKPVSMSSFKESGTIEYSSDVLIGLQLAGMDQKSKKSIPQREVESFDFDKEMRKYPREIELKILKNRNGETGGTIKFDFYSKFNHFQESNQ